MKNDKHVLDAKKHDTFSGGPSFPVTHRAFRLLFGLTWLLFARWTPPAFHRWRIFLLNLFGAKIARSAQVYACVKIWYPPNLVMAKQSVLGRGVNCYCMDKIEIGERAVVSQRTFLCAGSHKINDPNFQLTTSPINISSKSWVAAEAFVGPGIIIGVGAILAARGVAVKNLDPWTIYGGNPAKIIGQRTKF